MYMQTVVLLQCGTSAIEWKSIFNPLKWWKESPTSPEPSASTSLNIASTSDFFTCIPNTLNAVINSHASIAPVKPHTHSRVNQKKKKKKGWSHSCQQLGIEVHMGYGERRQGEYQIHPRRWARSILWGLVVVASSTRAAQICRGLVTSLLSTAFATPPASLNANTQHQQQQQLNPSFPPHCLWTNFNPKALFEAGWSKHVELGNSHVHLVWAPPPFLEEITDSSDHPQRHFQT